MPQLKPRYDAKTVLEAARRHPNSFTAAAKLIPCSYPTFVRYLRLAERETGEKVGINRNTHNKDSQPKVLWNRHAIAKLAAILDRDPIPEKREIAAEMGASQGAIQTSMSRFNLTPSRFSTNVDHLNFQKSRGTRRRLRNCVCCGKPFGSEGKHKHNRMCVQCGGLGSAAREESNYGA